MTTVVVESFRMEVDLPSADEGLDAVKASERLLDEAGFREIIRKTPIRERMDSANLLYPELNGPQLRITRQFMPTARPLGEHTYDVPPDEAIRLILSAQQLKLFDRIEIWTPEGNSGRDEAKRWWNDKTDKAREFVDRVVDPMAVGVINYDGIDHHYPIARWGEALLSVETITRKVRNQRAIAWMLTWLPAAVVVGIVAGCFATAAISFGFLNAVIVTVVIIVIAYGFSLW